MSDNQSKGVAAQRLLENEDFLLIIADIRAKASELFLHPSCAITDIQAAHEKVRATHIIVGALQACIASAKIETKRKDRDRNGD